ncbi:hypothetical protein DL768_011614 [Monosporascus sp. mg162]|nr:hypothetical protein DL768_011614 [Monosporascus sp. mg162]
MNSQVSYAFMCLIILVIALCFLRGRFKFRWSLAPLVALGGQGEVYNRSSAKANVERGWTSGSSPSSGSDPESSPPKVEWSSDLTGASTDS